MLTSIKSISKSPYTLKVPFKNNQLSGYLLRFNFQFSQDINIFGYACLQTWPHLSEPQVEDVLTALRFYGSTNNLISIKEPIENKKVKDNTIQQFIKAIICSAHRDASGRFTNRSLIKKNVNLKNNYLFRTLPEICESKLADLCDQGFSTIKIKLNPTDFKNVDFLKQVSKFPLKIRFDFNETLLETSDLENFVKKIESSILKQVQYFEDPFPYINYEQVNIHQADELAAKFKKNWFESSQRFPLAMDGGLVGVNKSKWKDLPCEVIVIKPAKLDLDINHLPKNKKIVITSNLDHPFGVANAYSYAQEIYELLPTQILDLGCLTLDSFEPNSYNESIHVRGPYILGTEGFGLGFSRQLEAEPWKNL